MARPEFSVEGRQVGLNHPPYVIAEAGVHHENSVGLAKQYVKQAAMAGADAIKFQTYSAEKLVTRWARTYWETGGKKTQYEIYREKSNLTEADYAELFDYASEMGITLLSTPFDFTAVDLLDELGIPVFKIASADLTHHPLLNEVASRGKPVFLSTGGAQFDEIERALDVLREGGNPVCLLHCSLNYPTPVAEANLQRIPRLRERFPGVLIGYSDHTRPDESELPCPTAVALGARVVEKHFTLNRDLEGDDHYHAVDYEGLCQLVEDCRAVFEMTIGFEETKQGENEARKYARRSIVAARDLEQGQTLDRDDVECKRPGTGISPEKLSEVLGKELAEPVEEDELIEPGHLRNGMT